MIGPDGQLSPGNVGRLSRAPWWLLAVALGATIFAWRAATSEVYAVILKMILSGLGVTLAVTLIAFPLAIAVGLLTALWLVSPHPVRRNAATLYVQVVRGVPILVQIFIVAFVLVPLGVEAVALDRGRDGLRRKPARLRRPYGRPGRRGARLRLWRLRGRDRARRPHLPCPGQAEAARALGLSQRQALRHVLLPQTFRRILPTLGNDLISLLKGLVARLGARRPRHHPGGAPLCKRNVPVHGEPHPPRAPLPGPYAPPGAWGQGARAPLPPPCSLTQRARRKPGAPSSRPGAS